jgi:serine/threonine protein kinase
VRICLNQRSGKRCGTENPDGVATCQQCGQPLDAALQLHNAGVMIGPNYRIIRLIGCGGFGAVYEAEVVRRPGIRVALKETFDPSSVRSFQREFVALHRIRHDHLPRYYEMFEQDGNGYLVMEMVPGQSLLHILTKKQGPLLESQVIGYALQICDALTFLHTRTPPLFHRDIKPANIRFTPDGVIKLVDFGLLKQGTDATESSCKGLTPTYAPLEQWEGTGIATSGRTDMYSLAATLYHLLSGKEPLSVPYRMATAPDPLQSPRDHNPRISPHVADAVLKAMAIRPEDRFADAATFRRALVESGVEQPQGSIAPQPQPQLPLNPRPQVQSPAPQSGTTVVLRRASMRNWWIVGVAVLVWLVIAGVMSFAHSNGSTEEPHASSSALNSATATPTATPLPPTATPLADLTNPLFPVTIEEWRNEMARRNQTFSPSGAHYWRYVPGGTYRIGGWLDDDDEGNDVQANVDMPTFWMAKHPITVQQYAQFIRDDGYNKSIWWTEGVVGWTNHQIRTQPEWWNDPRYNADNQPVVGVVWYEATAFANWLNAQLVGELPEGYRVRLPTEAEWEVVCAYDAQAKRHTYPWGDAEPTRNLADFDDDDEDEPGYASAVGMRSDGAAAAGVQDMVGSVWEYMTSGYDGYAMSSDVVVEDFSVVEGNVPLRGGSWWDERVHSQCGARIRDYPIFGTRDQGFRLVISP